MTYFNTILYIYISRNRNDHAAMAKHIPCMTVLVHVVNAQGCPSNYGG